MYVADERFCGVAIVTDFVREFSMTMYALNT